MGNQPVAVAVNAVTNFIYVANKGSNTVTAINGSNNSAQNIPVGNTPVAVAVNAVSNEIYAANNADGTVTAINGSTLATTVVSAGTQPAQIAADPVTNKIYVSNTGSNSATMIDGAALWMTNSPSAVRRRHRRQRGERPDLCRQRAGRYRQRARRSRQQLAAVCSSTTLSRGRYAQSEWHLWRPADHRRQLPQLPADRGRLRHSVQRRRLLGQCHRGAARPVGYLTIWPTGEGQPTVSTLNSLDGRIKANAAIVPAGTPDGSVSVYVTNTTNVVLDINGYFTTGDGSTLAFYPLTPCRVADTRNANGPLGGPSLSGGTWSATSRCCDSSCGLPSDAAAYSFNFTVVPKTTMRVGYLTVWPYGQTRPVVSTLNDLTGTIVANAALVPAGTGGEIAAYRHQRH